MAAVVVMLLFVHFEVILNLCQFPVSAQPATKYVKILFLVVVIIGIVATCLHGPFVLMSSLPEHSTNIAGVPRVVASVDC